MACDGPVDPGGSTHRTGRHADVMAQGGPPDQGHRRGVSGPCRCPGGQGRTRGTRHAAVVGADQRAASRQMGSRRARAGLAASEVVRRETRCRRSHLAGTPPVEHPPVTLRGPTRAAIASGHRNRGDRRRRGSPVEVARHGICRAHSLLNDSDHLDDASGVADSSPHLVARRNHGRRFRQSVVDAHVSAPACRGGVRSRLRQPDRPQPPIYTGRLHAVHHAPAARRSSARSGRGCRTCRRVPRSSRCPCRWAPG